MTNSDIHRAQEAAMTEAQTSTEKPVRKSRSTKSQGAAPTEPVDFNKLAQETREKMARKENPPASETVAQAAHAQVQEPAAPMPAHARFQVGQVLGVKAGDGLPGNWSGVMMKFVEPEVYIVRYRWAGETFEGEFERNQLTMMPHPAVGMRLEAGDLVGVRGVQQFGIVSYFDEKKERASVMVAGESATRDFSLEGLDFHGSKVVERSLKFVGLETFALPEAEQPAEDTPEAAPVTAHFAAGDFVKVQQKKETVLAGVQVIHPSGTLYVLLADQGGAITTKPGDCTVTHVRPVAPLRAGDLVHLSLRMGVWEVVSQEGDVVEVVNPLDESEKASSPLSGLLVTRRKNLDDLRADLGYSDQTRQQEDMPFPEVEEAAAKPVVSIADQLNLAPGTRVLVNMNGNDEPRTPGEIVARTATGYDILVTENGEQRQESLMFAVANVCVEVASEEGAEASVTPTDVPGWIFPRGQHLAHWWNGEKALCGREVADGTSIEENSDPSAYADRTCRKCRAALNKQPPVQAATEPAETSAASDIPAVINDIPGELPGTPRLNSLGVEDLTSSLPEKDLLQHVADEHGPLPDVTPGTLGVVHAPLGICVKSNCNVRMHYDDTKVQEIAASIKADGQLQECVGRWNSEGLLEIVAGETRRRAQMHRQEQGETDLTLRVHVRDLTDAQALRISAQENMARKDMTPLEECEAMLRMQEAGDTVENIQATFGYKTAQPVVDRILVAKNLHSKARDALDNRELSLAQAMVIARAPGDDLQKNMLTSATGYNPASAQRLAEMLTRGQFLVEYAKFDVDSSGLEVKRDLFDALKPYFESKPKALDAQVAWAEDKAAKLRKKGKHAFVDVVLTSDSHHSLTFGHSKYEREYDKSAKGRGLVLHIHEYSGEYNEVSDIRLKAAKTVTTTKADGTTTTESVREMPASAYDEAHVLRARALRHSLLGQKRTTLVLTVHALLVWFGNTYGRASIEKADAWQAGLTTPEIDARLEHWQTILSEALGTTPALAHASGEAIYGDDMNLKTYRFLSTLDEPELLDLLNVLVAARIYEPHADVKKPAAPTFVQLAQETNANAYLAQTFKLTDEWLKRYPRHELVSLAEEAGLGRALVEDCKTLKDMRGRILEHADTLHKEGFVPKIVQFAELKAAQESAAD